MCVCVCVQNLFHKFSVNDELWQTPIYNVVHLRLSVFECVCVCVCVHACSQFIHTVTNPGRHWFIGELVSADHRLQHGWTQLL